MAEGVSLRENYLTVGHTCLPICKDCLWSGKKSVEKGEKNATEERKEKEGLSGK